MGRDHFLTKKNFNNIFSFKSKGEIGPNTLWSPSSFWATNAKLNASPFQAGHSKFSYFSSKPLWYIHRFIIYTFNARGLSNEAVSFDEIYALK